MTRKKVIQARPTMGIAEEDVVVPKAEFIFDSITAGLWLINGAERKRKVFKSIRFEPEGMPLKQIPFLLGLAAAAIVDTYQPNRKLPDMEQGILYVPLSLAGLDVLSGYQKVSEMWGYAIFVRAI